MSPLKRLCVALALISPLLGCSSAAVHYVGPYSARWVRHQVRLYEEPNNEAQSQVSRKVIYAGKPAYLIPSPCCDKFDYLYDSKGVILCAPSGGFAGRGDGSCPEVRL